MVDWDWDKKNEEEEYDGPGAERGQVSPRAPPLPAAGARPPAVCQHDGGRPCANGEARRTACHAPNAAGGSPLEARAGVRPAAAGMRLRACGSGVRLNLHTCRQINRSDEIGARSRERLENAKKQAQDAGVHTW